MINEHRIEIQASAKDVFGEVVLWGESKWWPKDSLMEFINLKPEIDVGTVYCQKVKLPFAPKWHVKITEIKELTHIRRDFLDGMFSGYESVGITPQGEYCRVTYKMDYTVRGFFNRVMWKTIFEKLHNQNITHILAHLKKYLEKK